MLSKTDSTPCNMQPARAERAAKTAWTVPEGAENEAARVALGEGAPEVPEDESPITFVFRVSRVVGALTRAAVAATQEAEEGAQIERLLRCWAESPSQATVDELNVHLRAEGLPAWTPGVTGPVLALVRRALIPRQVNPDESAAVTHVRLNGTSVSACTRPELDMSEVSRKETEARVLAAMRQSVLAWCLHSPSRHEASDC